MMSVCIVGSFLPLGGNAAQLLLTWTDNSSNETGFLIERSTIGGAFFQIASTAANVTSFTDSNLTDSTDYSYRIRAYSGALFSSYTGSVTARTQARLPDANTPPTVSSVANRSVVATSSTGAIPFIVGDATTLAASLTVTSTSSNPSLVPASAIVLRGSGASRSITVTPPGTSSGTATITIRVSDGVLTTSTTFLLTVTPLNLPPTVTTPASRTVESATSTGPIPFTIGDTQTEVSRLVVTGSSSNTALVPNSAIVFGGSGANRTITLTPSASATGTALISLTVFDGALSTTTSFTLTVIPFSAPPVISGISNLSTSVNGLVRAPFTVDDRDTPIDLIQVTATSSNAQLLPSSALILGRTSGSRTLNATLNRGASGTTVITLTANDGVKTTNLQITLTVLTANSVPWIAGLADLTTRANFLAGQPFTAGDAETSASSLSVTATSSNPLLIANSAIRLGESGLQRSIALIPARGRTGTALISIIISDGVLSSSKTFTVNVTL